MYNDHNKSYYNNPFVVLFVINFLGFISLSFLGVNTKSGRITCTILIFCYLFLKRLKLDKNLYNNDIVNSCLLFTISCIPSIFFSSNPLSCVYKIAELYLTTVFIITGVSYFKVGSINVFKFLLLYFVLQTLIAFVGYFIDPMSMNIEDDVMNGRNYVTMLRCNYPPTSSNSLGGIAAISLLICIGFYFSALKKNEKLLIFVIGGISLFVLYKSSSRTALLSTVIALVYMIRKLLSLQKLFMVCLCVCLIGFYFSDSIITEVESIIMKSQTSIAGSNGSIDWDLFLSGRVRIWEAALNNKNNLLFGLGFGTAIKDLRIADGNAHNSFVEILVNCGLIALFFWIRIWYILIKKYRQLIKYKRYLPLDEHWYYFSLGLVFMAFVRSWGNLSFVYWQLDSFAIIAVAILFIYSEKYLNNLKFNIKNK